MAEREYMKIIDKTENVKVTFKSLELEDIFKYDDRLFMKVSQNGEYPYNAYDFSKSRLTDITEDTEVKYVPSELILHQRDWEE